MPETAQHPPYLRQRAKLAALRRWRDPDDPVITDATRDLSEARLAAEIDERAGGLTIEQRERLAAQLLAGSDVPT